MLASESRPPAPMVHIHHDPRRRGSRRLSHSLSAHQQPPPQISTSANLAATAAGAGAGGLGAPPASVAGGMPTTPTMNGGGSHNHVFHQQQQQQNGVGGHGPNGAAAAHIPPPLSSANGAGGHGAHGGRSSRRQSSSAAAASPSSPTGTDKEQALYKTELCTSYSTNGKCRYGAKCQFAHGKEELRHVARHPKYKTELCRNFSLMGTCVYEQRCRFIHDETNDELAQLNCLNSPARCVTHGPDAPAEARIKAARNPRHHSIATGSPAHEVLLHHRDTMAAAAAGLPLPGAAGLPSSSQFHPHLVQFTYGAMGGGGGGRGPVPRNGDGPPPSASAGTAYGAHPHPGGREAAERRRRSGPPIMLHAGSHRVTPNPLSSPLHVDDHHFFQSDFDLDHHPVPVPAQLKAIHSLGHIPDSYRPSRGDIHRTRSASVSVAPTDVAGLLPFAAASSGGPPPTSSAFYRHLRLPTPSEDGPSVTGASGSDGSIEDAAIRRGSHNLSPTSASMAAAAAPRSSPYARHAAPPPAVRRGLLGRSGSVGRLFPEDHGPPPSMLGSGYPFGRRRHSSVLHESSALRSSMVPPIDLDGVGPLPPVHGGGMRRSPRGSFSGVSSPSGTSSSSTDPAPPGNPSRSPLIRSRSPTRPQSSTNAAKKAPIGRSPRSSLATDGVAAAEQQQSGSSSRAVSAAAAIANAKRLGAGGRRVSTPAAGLRFSSHHGRTSNPSSPHSPDFGSDYLQPIGTPVSQRHLRAPPSTGPTGTGELHMRRSPPRSQSLFALHQPYGGLLGSSGSGMSSVEGMNLPSPGANGFRKPPMKYPGSDDLYLHMGPPPRSALAKRRESSPATGMHLPPSIAAKLSNGIHNHMATSAHRSAAAKTPTAGPAPPRSIGAITEEPGPPGRVRRAASEAGIPRRDLKPTTHAAAAEEADFFDNFKSLSIQPRPTRAA